MASTKSNASKFALILGILILAMVALVIYLLITGGNYVSSRIDFVTQSLASRSGLSIFLVKGAALIVTIPFFASLAAMTKDMIGKLTVGSPALDPFQFYRDRNGIVVILYTGLFWITMYFASRHAYAYKFCAVTPEGIKTADSAGKDPVYGVEFKPCTQQQAKILRNGEGELLAAQEVFIRRGKRIQWFNAATGQPQIWYSKRDDGFHIFDNAGNDPESGDPLKPVTPEIVTQITSHWRSAQTAQASELQRQQQIAADQSAAARAQDLFDARNYKAALQACKPVLSRAQTDETCVQIKRNASVGLAHQLVDDGQGLLQRAQFDAALNDAEQAMQLDPENEPAKTLRDTALVMKKRYSLN